MRKFSAVCLFAIAVLLSSSAAWADTLNFTLTGQGQTMTFSLPSSPTSFSSTVANGFAVANVSYVLNGTSRVTGVAFNNDNNEFFYGDGAVVTPTDDTVFASGPEEFFKGDALFTGPGTAPVFKTGTFSEDNTLGNFAGLGLPAGEYTMTITDPSATPAVPEPSSLLLLGTGVAGIFGNARRRYFRRS